MDNVCYRGLASSMSDGMWRAFIKSGERLRYLELNPPLFLSMFVSGDQISDLGIGRIFAGYKWYFCESFQFCLSYVTTSTLHIQLPSMSVKQEFCLDIRGSVHHSKIHKEKSKKMQQCIKILLFHISMKLNMLRPTHRPSSGA